MLQCHLGYAVDEVDLGLAERDDKRAVVTDADAVALVEVDAVVWGDVLVAVDGRAQAVDVLVQLLQHLLELVVEVQREVLLEFEAHSHQLGLGLHVPVAVPV